MSTAGRAALFAGTTVLISLPGLSPIGQQYFDGPAAGTILAVMAVMAASLSLLPAMPGFPGRAIDRLRLPGLLQPPAPGTRHGIGWRRSRTVQRRPAPCRPAAAPVLAAPVIPLFSMRQAITNASTPHARTTRQAHNLISAGLGPGFNGPLVTAAELPSRPSDQAAATTAEHRPAAVPDVAAVQAPANNPAGDAPVTAVYPAPAPPGRSHRIAGPPPSLHRHPASHRRHRRDGARRRRDRGGGRRAVVYPPTAPTGHRPGDRAVGHAAHGRVPARHHPPKAAADEIAATGPVITAAAIMTCVFGSFITGDPARVLDMFGPGLAVAIPIDATMARTVLVPPTMQLPGHPNWSPPRPLDRATPRPDMETTPASPTSPMPAGNPARSSPRNTTWPTRRR